MGAWVAGKTFGNKEGETIFIFSVEGLNEVVVRRHGVLRATGKRGTTADFSRRQRLSNVLADLLLFLGEPLQLLVLFCNDWLKALFVDAFCSCFLSGRSAGRARLLGCKCFQVVLGEGKLNQSMVDG